MTDISDDDLFESAKDEFPAKEDMRGRLVAMLVDGKRGTRQSNTTGKAYEYVSTTTIVLDDGVDGTTYTDLIPSVADTGPFVNRGFQWSAGPFVARLKDRTPEDRWIIGRVNEQEKPAKGRSAAWRPDPATEPDMEIVRVFASLLKAEKAHILSAQAEAEPVF